MGTIPQWRPEEKKPGFLGVCYLYFRTIRHLKPIQIWRQLGRKNHFYKQIDLSELSQRPSAGEWICALPDSTKIVSENELRILNQSIPLENKSEIWKSSNLDSLTLYQLHYFGFIRNKSEQGDLSMVERLIESWIEENPVRIGVGWDSYPTSQRITNWIRWSLDGYELSQQAKESLALQANYLIQNVEYGLLANHFFVNAKALVFAGLFFEGAEADKWLSKGLGILKKEVNEQILADGGHFERSPMYHSLILEDLLDLINITQVYENNFSRDLREQRVIWVKKAKKMFGWLAVMVHSDENISFFNDSTLSVAPKLNDLRKYAERLDINLKQDSSSGLKHLQNTGFVRAEKGPAILIADIGNIAPSYNPGHAHAETLSFELSLFGERVIVNSGISTYEGNSLRHFQRGTKAHSTLEINGKNSSEVWKSFRVARRAKIFNIKAFEGNNVIRILCSQDGYKTVLGGCYHAREFDFKENRLKIIDTIRGRFKTAVSRFYFHPGLKVEFDEEAQRGEITLSENSRVSMLVAGGVGRLVESKYFPGFNMSSSNRCLEIQTKASEFFTAFHWEGR